MLQHWCSLVVEYVGVGRSGKVVGGRAAKDNDGRGWSRLPG